MALAVLFVWPLSFISIYSRPNTRIDASEWINKNIPEGATIAVEHWDDRIPMFVERNYKFNELNLYDQPDDEIKWTSLSHKINGSSYIIIASNRLYVPIQNLSDCKLYKVCFPTASKYYDDLFSGRLGFEKVKEFDSSPTIPVLNLPINDQNADESFTVYDHPKIQIYKKMVNN